MTRKLSKRFVVSPDAAQSTHEQRHKHQHQLHTAYSRPPPPICSMTDENY